VLIKKILNPWNLCCRTVQVYLERFHIHSSFYGNAVIGPIDIPEDRVLWDFQEPITTTYLSNNFITAFGEANCYESVHKILKVIMKSEK